MKTMTNGRLLGWKGKDDHFGQVNLTDTHWFHPPTGLCGKLRRNEDGTVTGSAGSIRADYYDGVIDLWERFVIKNDGRPESVVMKQRLQELFQEVVWPPPKENLPEPMPGEWPLA